MDCFSDRLGLRISAILVALTCTFSHAPPHTTHTHHTDTLGLRTAYIRTVLTYIHRYILTYHRPFRSFTYIHTYKYPHTYTHTYGQPSLLSQQLRPNNPRDVTRLSHHPAFVFPFPTPVSFRFLSSLSRSLDYKCPATPTISATLIDRDSIHLLSGTLVNLRITLPLIIRRLLNTLYVSLFYTTLTFLAPTGSPVSSLL